MSLQVLRDLAVAQQRPLLEVLAEQWHVDVRQAGARLAREFGMTFWGSAELLKTEPRFAEWPLARALQARAVLVEQSDSKVGAPNHAEKTLFVVMADPYDGLLNAQMERAAGVPVTPVVATVDDILAYLGQHEATHRAVDALHAQEAPQATDTPQIEMLSLAQVEQASSVAVKLVNSTLYDALRAGASDVHLESTPSGLAVKYRIDGVLNAVTHMNGQALAEQTLSRLKVLSELDIAERRVPQDGSFQVSALGRKIDLRVSVMPSIHGEDAVIRVLDKQAMLQAHGSLTLEALGFDAASLATMRELIRAAYGMLLVTGPTGSGKTTTLYAALAETHTGRDKIITIEDPVEYQLPGVLQIPVNEKKGLTFARGLRSILRHDPDKIMVGEIRDRETAEIAVQSALTGHLVLTTVHANNVFDVFGRFTHMGLDPYSLVSALNGIWAQRLLRLNCPHCAEPLVPEASALKRFGLSGNVSEYAGMMRGVGCSDCRGTGYRGRRAIAEFLLLDDELREAIVTRQPTRQIKTMAEAKGTRSLRDAALDLVFQGATTLEEVSRVTLVV